MTKTVTRLWALLALGTAAVAAQAHFLWATVVPATKTFSIEFAESPGDSVMKDVAGKSKVVLPTVEKKPFTLNLDAGGEKLLAPAKGDAFGVTLHYGIINREGEFMLEYYAKAAASVKASQKSQGLKLELEVLERKEGQVTFKLNYNGKPAPYAAVVVYVNNGEDTVEAKTRLDGTVTVSVPEGQAITARALVPEKAKGTFDGKPYESVKHYTTLTIPGA